MISIRRATASDYDILPDVERDAAQVFQDFGLNGIACMEPLSPRFYKGLTCNSAVFVADDTTSGIVGFSVVVEVDNQAHLKEISVRKSSSGKGTGRKLLEAAILWAAKRYRLMTLTTFSGLPFKDKFYEKYKFVPFAPDSTWPDLLAIRKEEKTSGVDSFPRVAMIRTL